MPNRFVKAPNTVMGWGLVFLLLSSPVSSQVLQGWLDIDTRDLFASSGLPREGWQDGSIELLQLPMVSQPRIRIVSSYDDVYREEGTQYRTQVDRFEYGSYFEVPLGPEGGCLGFELSHLTANGRVCPSLEERVSLGWAVQRFAVGIGRHLWGRRLTAGGKIAVTHMDGGWLPGAALALAIRPRPAISLAAHAGWQPDTRMVDWKIEGEEYRAEVKFWHRWWAAEMKVDFSPRFSIETGYKHGWIYAPAKWYEGVSFGFNPAIASACVKAVVQYDLTDRTALILRLKTAAIDGSGESYHHGQPFGKLTTFLLDETDVELIGTCWSANSARTTFSYGNYQVASTQRGHQDPWPFSIGIFDQLLRVYYRGSGEARVNRLALEYARSPRAVDDWALVVGYVWMTPDLGLLQRRTKLIIFDSGELTRSYLNVIQAEFLALEARKSIILGGIALTYSFTKAIPTWVRLREKPPPPEPPEVKKKAKGGNFHMLELAYVW
ncbi:MAG: hypothetical protein ACETWG_10870 [Candidatus Neomarinimicrobiota bacterium]